MMHELEAIRFPLHGSRLIEASAGTGKTWTIAALYLRLVLGHGEGSASDAAPAAFHRPLLPAEILVMTFTRAATRELSDRIRARLTEAALCFRGERAPSEGDSFLCALLEDYPDEAARRHAAWRLALAAEAMDDAAVFTIDAWCQRMLREHAFDSGNPFDEELAADERALLTEAVQDYWRQHGYPLAGEQLDFVLGLWPKLDELLKDMRDLVGLSLSDAALESPLAQCVDAVREPHREALEALSRGWAERAEEMKAWLDKQLAHNKKAWDGRKLQARHYTPWIEDLIAWAADPHGQKLELSKSARHRLTPAGLLEARKSDAAALTDLPEHFEAFASLVAAYDALPDPYVPLRAHAAAHVAKRLAVLKRHARSFGFADLLERLEAALRGPHGARLRERIVTQYPVALIDEFQDTSPLQYRLFDLLYRTADNDTQTALLLIGDPKQSIYGFRGADIYSYLQARRATAGRHYVLGTNYRSTVALVDAVNAWFERAETRGDEAGPEGQRGGAFLFRNGPGNDLPFNPVAAKGRAEVFQCESGPVPALTIHHDLNLRSAKESRQLFADRCAERIVAWLNDERAGFLDEDRQFKRLRPADVAVLVRTGKEAVAVRRALSRRGVASVYLSDQDSVFASDEARDLLHWLRAVAAPLDAQRVRTGLATRSVGLSIAELAQLAADDEAFERRSELLHELHRVWRERGVLTMLRRTLHLLDLPARWLAEPEGERRLTNFLHLAELLQRAGSEIDGEQALTRWLTMRIEDSERASGDEQIVRLESDADLVKVVTVHKSKGLEYPVVCLPFACSYRRVERRTTRYLKLADASGAQQVKLTFSDDELERADQERLREDLRLFYVALTRASHALWMGFAAIKIGNSKECLTHRSAPGYLLAGGASLGEAEWLGPIEALASQARSEAPDPAATPQPLFALEAAQPELACTLLQRRAELPALETQPPYAAEFERRWGLGSYSALVRDLANTAGAGNGVELVASASAMPQSAAIAPSSLEALALSALQRRNPAEDEGEDGQDVLPAERLMPALAPWHRFPRGALSGNFLHEVLEWLAEENFALVDDPHLQAALQKRCERAGRAKWSADVLAWMTSLLATPLPSLDCPLQALHSQLPELEFWMPSDNLQAAEVDALCQRHLLDSLPRPALPQRTLHGMLMGFADLVFEHGGRYWVLDYKSNSLGTGAEAYSRSALEAAMAHHRYDVQAAIYLLALHRLLRSRLGADYDPGRQLGGAIYFFLRGIDGPVRGEYAILATPAVLSLIDALDHLLDNEALQP